MTTESQTPATGENNQPPAAAPAATSLLTDPAVQATPPATDPQAPSTEGQPPAEPKPEDKPQGAPEQYAEFTAPEGIAFNPDVVTDLKALAKEYNLTQEAAQKFADLGAKAAKAQADAYAGQITQLQGQWAEAATTDKEYGGDKLNENMALANRALSTFGSPELVQMLQTSKLGNHPEVIRAFYRVGKAISEDKLIAGTTKPANADPLKAMYPTMTN